MGCQELLIALWVNKLQLLLHTNSPHWSPYRLYIKKSWIKQLLKDQSILLLNITFNSHNLSTRLCFEFCLEEINFCQGLKGSTTKLNQCTFFLSFCSKSVIVSTGGDCLAAWLDRGLLFTAASFTRCWSSTRYWQTKQCY